MDYVQHISKIITEDPDIFRGLKDIFKERSVLKLENYYQVLALLKKTAQQNGCVLNFKLLKAVPTSAGFTIKNINLECPNKEDKQALIDKLAEKTGDKDIKHNFDANLKVNLYNAISGDFANMVRQELNLDLTHQYKAFPPGARTDRALVLPQVTITVPQTAVSAPEEISAEIGMPEPTDIDMEAPQTPEQELDQILNQPMGSADDLGFEPEAKESEDNQELPSDITFENISIIANLITDDPDILNH